VEAASREGENAWELSLLLSASGTTFTPGLLDARARTDDVFRVVREEAMYDRPIPERHRIIFYVGHVEAFDWNLLPSALSDCNPFSGHSITCLRLALTRWMGIAFGYACGLAVARRGREL